MCKNDLSDSVALILIAFVHSGSSSAIGAQC